MTKTPIEQLEEIAILAKSHVDGYTRSDGSFVQAHDDKRQAAKPPEQVASVKPKPKSHAKLHKDAEAGVKGSPAHEAHHADLLHEYANSTADWQRQTVNRLISKNWTRAEAHKKAQSEKP